MSSQNKQNKISGKNWVKKYFAKSVNATKGVKGANFYNGSQRQKLKKETLGEIVDRVNSTDCVNYSFLI